MDNVILWIKSNKDVVDAYKKTKHECNYDSRTDNDFLMFLLEAATNVLSIVHQFSPQISCITNNDESTPIQETMVTKETDINLEKLDKQLRISIVCPDLDKAPSKESEPIADSSSALQDISDHVNELETVLESLSKSCPSPLSAPKRSLSARTFLESYKTASSSAARESSFQKFKLPNIMISTRSLNNSTRSSPNVTISAESQLNMYRDSNTEPPPRNLEAIPLPPPPIAVPIPTKPKILKSPTKESHSSEEKDVTIDVVTNDPGTENYASSLKRKVECLDNSATEETAATPATEVSNSVPVAVPSSVSPPRPVPPPTTSAPDTTNNDSNNSSTVKEEPPEEATPDIEMQQIPTEAELTHQLMTVIQNTLSVHNLQSAHSATITCQECGLIFANEINLHRHMLTHAETEKGVEQYNCPTCAFKTPRRQTLAKHINTVHSRDRTSGILYCDQCEYKTPTKSHLRNHMLAHSGNRQYQCPHCTYNSNFSNALTRHMTMHSREMFENKMTNVKP